MLLTFGILDGIWLGAIANQWYFGSLSSLLREQFITWPWLVFYLAYCAATLYLAVVPASGHWQQAAVKGAVLGATAYGAYNLTNYSIVANWPLPITLIDWSWGTLATAVVSTSGALALKLKH
ncbi:membrane protein [Alteromonas lipolytica]|nr:membrane protein [Alteromonas lipolytica]